MCVAVSGHVKGSENRTTKTVVLHINVGCKTWKKVSEAPDSSLYTACVHHKLCNVYVYFRQLTVDQGAESPVSPIPHRVVDFWGLCISVTTVRLSEDYRTSPTSPPTGSAAQGHLTLHTRYK